MSDEDNNSHANAVNEQLRKAEEEDDIPESTADRSMARLAVDTDKLTAENDLDYLIQLVLEAKRHDGNWDGDETEAAKWAIAQWCQEKGWGPNLQDIEPGQQVPKEGIPNLDAVFYSGLISGDIGP